MDRVLQGAPATISTTLYSDETEVASSTAVAVAVTNDFGTELHTDTADLREGTTGTYEFTLPAADTATLDILTVEWTATIDGVAQTRTTRVEVVGGFHVSLAEIRANGAASSLPLDKYTTADLRDARTTWEDLAESYTNQAWVPRYRRLRLYGPSAGIATPLPLRAVRWATYDGTAVDAATLALWEVAHHGFLHTGRTWSGQVIEVGVEVGHDQPPADLRDAALVYIVESLRKSRANVRALSQIAPDGTITKLSYKGRTQIPSVDATLDHHRVPVIA